MFGGFVMFVGAFFYNEEYLHTFFAFLFVLASSLACFFVYTWAKFVVALFLERVISTHFIRFFFCVRRLIVWRFCYVYGRLF